MMSKYIKEGEQIYMQVRPAHTLMRSKTLSEIYQRGDTLAVNLDTGVLVVMRTEKIDQIERLGIRAYYQPDGMKSVRLSDDPALAVLQIQDQYAIGRTSGRFWYNNSNDERRHFDSFSEEEPFFRKVREAYIRYHNGKRSE